MSPQGPRLSVSLRSVFTVCFAVLSVVALVAAVMRALVVVALTAASILLAVALDHLVSALERRGIRRSFSILIVVMGAVFLATAIGFLLVPPAVSQAQAFIEHLPNLLRSLGQIDWLRRLTDRVGVSQWIQRSKDGPIDLLRGAASPVLAAVSGIVSFLGGAVTLMFLTILMLIFGGRLVRNALAEASDERRDVYAILIKKIYASLGGYFGGMIVICSINALLTSTFLAINRIPFFLPLGLVSGLSSLVPYAGPVICGALISILCATVGVWHGVASAVYFVIYGQLEGNVIGPLVFRQTVHVDPLIALLSVLFFGEIAGIAGAIAAVPLAATLQIVLREVLSLRRERKRLFVDSASPH